MATVESLGGREWQVESETETVRLGALLGRSLQEGDIVGLMGPLGAGKTAFTRGVAQGLGIEPTDVSSPTFAVLQTYESTVPLHHADLYRLQSAEDLYATGFFDILNDGGCAVVEWVERLGAQHGLDMLSVSIEVVSEHARRLSAVASGVQSEALLKRWTTASPKATTS